MRYVASIQKATVYAYNRTRMSPLIPPEDGKEPVLDSDLIVSSFHARLADQHDSACH